MAEHQNIPEADTSLPQPGKPKGILHYISSVDHKQLGVMYMLVALFFFLLGGVGALLMRTQLLVPENEFMAPDMYNQIFTLHGTTMIFLVLTPALIGFGVYFTPLMIGANDLAFPRLNALALWLTLFGGLMLYWSFFAGGAPDAGWFNYAPLSTKTYSPSPGIDYFCTGLLITGIGTLSAGLNFLVTIIKMRIKGMRYSRMPLFVWMIGINSILIIGALPPLNAALSMLLIDRQLNAHFFNAATGGSAIVWQHLFWLFGHPEVYILILPAFGILSEIFPVFSRKPIFGYKMLVISGTAIMLLSYLVWGHHMFSVGLGNNVNTIFAATSLLIAVPTGIKILNWIGTMWGGSLQFTTSMLFGIAFLMEFTLGGLSGVAFAIVPIDWQLTDSYFVVAHLHYVFVGGSFFALMAGVYYWYPKITGRLLDERQGKWFFWLFVIGFNLTFFLQHILGTLGMPRRVYTYPDLPGYAILNFLASIGAYLMGVAVLVHLYSLYSSLRKGKPAGKDPWDAFTLEWSTASPPPPKNFTALPEVKSARPLWDQKMNTELSNRKNEQA